MMTTFNQLWGQYIVLLVLSLVLTNCKKDTETVVITPNISVELPKNFEFFEKQAISTVQSIPDTILSKSYNFRATIHGDDIFISKVIDKAFDTLSLEQQKAKLAPNLKGYVRGFQGNNLVHKDTIIQDWVQSDLSFEAKLTDTPYMIYCRLIIQDSNLVFMNYMAKLPMTKQSIKDKDHFFKSITHNQ